MPLIRGRMGVLRYRSSCWERGGQDGEHVKTRDKMGHVALRVPTSQRCRDSRMRPESSFARLGIAIIPDLEQKGEGICALGSAIIRRRSILAAIVSLAAGCFAAPAS